MSRCLPKSLQPRVSKRGLHSCYQHATDTSFDAIESDKRFFEQYPHRQHRIRPACEGEIDAMQLSGNTLAPPPYREFCVIQRYGRGLHLRAFVSLVPRDPATFVDNATEDLAARLFALATRNLRRRA